MDRKGVWQWGLVLIVLIVLLYAFFKPTGKVIFDIQTGSNEVSSCGILNSSGEYVLVGNVAGEGSCIDIRANNISLDCDSYLINASDSLVSDKQYTDIVNCVSLGDMRFIGSLATIKDSAIGGKIVLTNSSNVELVNVSYGQANVEASSLVRKWYFVLNVSDANGVVEGANASISSDESAIEGVSNSAGLIGTTLIDGKNYTISITKEGYDEIVISTGIVTGNLVKEAVLVESEEEISVSLNSPTIGVTNVSISYTISALADKCSAVINGAEHANNTALVVGSNVILISGLSASTSYSYLVSCNFNGSIVNSSSSSFTTLSAPSTSNEEEEEEQNTQQEQEQEEEQQQQQQQTQVVVPTVARNYPLPAAEFNGAGSLRLLFKGDGVIVDYNGKKYIVLLSDVTKDKATLKATLQGSNNAISTISLANGQYGNIDLDGNKVYDVFAMIKEIKDGRAKIFFKSTNEKVAEPVSNKSAVNQTSNLTSAGITGKAVDEATSSSVYIGIGVIVGLVIVFFIAKWYMRKKSN